ncbi:copper homeostasis membrane protein CopD [Novosphingobium olei]|jgi:putative copper resistance protein D|uniref:Copper homeostasis membrane protein CopD n=1 Tax=Novosphingobium olei TaxID=2728851 RepID=A0A7Y0G9T2_9SPHN|nr:copper homeostasis membrane protein CopD [Novosphingobium olei]NML94325.1 copper homeostasis membrane protein CopD [Novosphingobium olei]
MDNLPVIAIRFVLYADLMVLAGMSAFSLYALTSQERDADELPLAKPAIALSLVGFLFSGFGMMALAASMTGASIWAVDHEVLKELIAESAIGSAWIVRMVALAVAVLSAFALQPRRSIARIGLLGSTALAITTMVWTGHAGATEGWMGTIHRLSDMVHMLAAAVWIGGIAALSLLLFRPLRHQTAARLTMTYRALEQFARVGSLAVALIVITGGINCLAVVGFPHFTQFPLTPYGKMLIGKLLLFAAMLVIAALNRWRLTPALSFGIRDDNPTSAVTGLRRSLLAEGSAALAILALVAWLGTLDPLSATG